MHFTRIDNILHCLFHLDDGIEDLGLSSPRYDREAVGILFERFPFLFCGAKTNSLGIVGSGAVEYGVWGSSRCYQYDCWDVCSRLAGAALPLSR
jgi:hypothetical protein